MKSPEPEPSQAAPQENPYDVLGVTPEMQMSAIAEAFRAMMLAVQNLPNGAPQRRLIAAFKEIKGIKARGDTNRPI
jgi:hypothetical protein